MFLQDECSLTHLSLAANGLTDSSVATLARFVCAGVISTAQLLLMLLGLCLCLNCHSLLACWTFLLLFHRCLSSCPTLVSLNLSGNPSVTSAGLHNILASVREARRPLTLLNLEGMHMCELGDTSWTWSFTLIHNLDFLCKVVLGNSLFLAISLFPFDTFLSLNI